MNHTLFIIICDINGVNWRENVVFINLKLNLQQSESSVSNGQRQVVLGVSGFSCQPVSPGFCLWLWTFVCMSFPVHLTFVPVTSPHSFK